MRFLLLALLAFSILHCSSDQAALQADGPTGTGGSLARFTVVGSHLYTLSDAHISWYELAPDGQIKVVDSLFLGSGKETLFPLGDLLFIGAIDGMSILEIDANGRPALQGRISHIVACDPVVANDSFAYVTLRLEGCTNGPNVFGNADREGLFIYNVLDIENPNHISFYNLPTPIGLGLHENFLFIGLGDNGLQVMDVTNPFALQPVARLTDRAVTDVIVLSSSLVAIGPDHITQYDYSDPLNLVELSTITR